MGKKQKMKKNIVEVNIRSTVYVSKVADKTENKNSLVKKLL